MEFRIYRGSRVSEGANNLAAALPALRLNAEGSRYRPRDNRLVINWGCTNDEAHRLWQLRPDRFLNAPEAVARASNKLNCLHALAEHLVPCVPFYTEAADALAHVQAGGRVYVRTALNGHSGEGIVLLMNRNDPQWSERGDLPFPTFSPDGELPLAVLRASLFTVGTIGKRVEWRVHVVDGQVVLLQRKVRRSGFQDNAAYTSLVRNIQTGWVYSVNFGAPTPERLHAIQSAAIGAVSTLGLDFGAVDIVETNIDSSRERKALVLEINTAPGLEEEASSLQAYVDAFRQLDNRIEAESE